MRAALALALVLGACQQPTPTPAPASAPAPTPAPTPTPPPPPAPTRGSATTPPPPPAAAPTVAASISQPDLVSPDCIAVADHLVTLSLAEITNPTEHAAQVANRARSVRTAAEACSRAGWSPAAIECFTRATKSAELAACGKLLTAAR